MTAARGKPYLFVSGDLTHVGTFNDDRLQELNERHKLAFQAPHVEPCSDLELALARSDVDGVLIQVNKGWPGLYHLKWARYLLRLGQRTWFYWPEESVVEWVEWERLRNHRRIWLAVHFYGVAVSMRRRLLGLPRRRPLPQEVPAVSKAPSEFAQELTAVLQNVINSAVPVPIAAISAEVPSPEKPLAGIGVYLRIHSTPAISAGGSYGHTCYVASALAKSTHRLVCLLSQRYSLLDDLGVEQTLVDSPHITGERCMLTATDHYVLSLRALLRLLKPTYIYERLVLGNYAAAKLSQELGIPYIVEYNGSEISMTKSFGGHGLVYEDLFLLAEKAAFRQATLISVVSERVRDDLVRRGVQPDKILVNPNGADPVAYAPPPPEEKSALRRDLGWNESHCVIGFTSTFGGWHGVDVLAAAIPRICERVPHARFLLIGTGSYKHLVDEQVRTHRLQRQVHSAGRVPQQEGARLLRACDLYVSPHSSHMVDSPFFGSPTKVFEYMALGGGIVASDLEQIGQVLSPALRVSHLDKQDLVVGPERAVLCTPGDVDEFTEAVVRLAARPDVSRALGRNARQAVVDQYSWDHHAARLWRALSHTRPSEDRPESSLAVDRILDTGDAFKDETQNQWNNNPCGSQYVKESAPRTLEWFKEVEAYRYGQYAPWMPDVMEFREHAGEEVLEIGGGLGTDLAQFALNGAKVTDVDLAAGHLELARENFKLRGLSGRFVHHDAETLPFDDDTFDLVYTNGVLHHTPNTARVIQEIRRVLKPGGKVVAMVYAEDSLHYWRGLVWGLGLRGNLLDRYSMGEIMSRHVELSENGAKPLVKVYTRRALKTVFSRFAGVEIVKRQLTPDSLPLWLRWIPLDAASRMVGWNLIAKGRKLRVERRQEQQQQPVVEEREADQLQPAGVAWS